MFYSYETDLLIGEKYQSDVLFAVSPLHLTGEIKPVGCILRFASESVSEVIYHLISIIYLLFFFQVLIILLESMFFAGC